MPCDSNHLIDVEYDEILCEIQALHIKHTCTYVMFGGDLNTDLSRYASMHTRSHCYVFVLKRALFVQVHYHCLIGMLSIRTVAGLTRRLRFLII